MRKPPQRKPPQQKKPLNNSAFQSEIKNEMSSPYGLLIFAFASVDGRYTAWHGTAPDIKLLKRVNRRATSFAKIANRKMFRFF